MRHSGTLRRKILLLSSGNHKDYKELSIVIWSCGGRWIVVVIAIRPHRVPKPGECEIIRTHPDRVQGPPSLLYKGHWVSFPGITRPECSVGHPLQSRAGVGSWYRVIPLRPVSAWLACYGTAFTITLKMYTVCFSKTLVGIYQNARTYSPEGRTADY